MCIKISRPKISRRMSWKINHQRKKKSLEKDEEEEALEEEEGESSEEDEEGEVDEDMWSWIRGAVDNKYFDMSMRL